MNKYYVVNKSGKLIGYTNDEFILNELYRYKKSLLCDNIFIHTYTCKPCRLVDILVQDYFAEEIYGIDLLESFKLNLYTNHQGKTVITSYSEIYEIIEYTDCISMAARNIIKATMTIIKYSKYLRDSNVEPILRYILLSYTQQLMRVEAISGNIKDVLDDENLCIDIIEILILLGYLNPL